MAQGRKDDAGEGESAAVTKLDPVEAGLKLLDVIRESNLTRQTLTTSGTGCVAHAAHRAQREPAHAQRIIGITNDGDQGLIALQVCKTYVADVFVSE